MADATGNKTQNKSHVSGRDTNMTGISKKSKNESEIMRELEEQKQQEKATKEQVDKDLMAPGGLRACSHKKLTKVQKQLLMLDDFNNRHIFSDDSECDNINHYFIDQNRKLMSRDLHVMIDANKI